MSKICCVPVGTVGFDCCAVLAVDTDVLSEAVLAAGADVLSDAVLAADTDVLSDVDSCAEAVSSSYISS
ncbi:MAG: hypothetical protein IJ679_02795 [Lachnospiraceae bacterium]|nr:hypothetical protein [Lachnospiraceae bacterium]